jgi:serine phosphatase RsbU (regulator of sigma subunit)
MSAFLGKGRFTLMRKVTWILFTIAPWLCIWAQPFPNHSPVVSFTPQANIQNISGFSRLFHDTLNTLTIHDIQKLPNTLWHQGPQGQKGLITPTMHTGFSLGYSPNTWWSYTIITNESIEQDDFLFSVNYSLMDSITIFIQYDTAHTVSYTSGCHVPFSARIINSRKFLFPLTLAPQDTAHIYVKFRNNNRIEYNITAGTQQSVINGTLYAEMLIFLYYGIILIMIVYYILMWITLKRRQYFDCTLYSLSTLFFMLYQNGLMPSSLLPIKEFVVLGMIFYGFAAPHFAQSYLHTQQTHSTWNKVLNIFKFIPVINFATLFFASLQFNILFGIIVAFSASLVLLALGIHLSILRIYMARFYLVTWSVFLVGVLLYIFNVLGIVPANLFTTYSIQFGAAINIVLFALGLTDQLNSIQKKNVSLQQILLQNQSTLQESVDIATGDLILLQQKLERTHNHFLFDLNIAYNIQRAILSEGEDLYQCFSQAFTLYRPKDKVGGDFYVSLKIGSKKWVALGDCTGHGIPGALMSITSSILLQQILRTMPLLSPAQVLFELNTRIKKLLHQEDKHSVTSKANAQNESNDGLDMAICMIENDYLHFALAHMPLVIFQNNQLTFIKGDSMRLGYRTTPFSQTWNDQKIFITKGNIIYITSDGLLDQCGGRKGVPWGKRRYLMALEEMRSIPLQEQKMFLENQHHVYRGQTPQMDDVTMIGFQI